MKNKRIAVIGAKGQLGSDLCIQAKLAGMQILALEHTDIEVADKDSVRGALDKIHPDVVINTAAYHNVDDVELHPDKAFLVNAIGARNVALYCQDKSIISVYISTDYVFGQQKKRSKPYTETDCPGPINVYGISKLAGEHATLTANIKSFVVRTSGLYGTQGASGKGKKNFIELMISLAKTHKPIRVVSDQITSPTYTKHLAMQIVKLLNFSHYGLYHAASIGQSSWFDFATRIFQLLNISVDIRPVKSSFFTYKAMRPHYSVLGNDRLKDIGLGIMPAWEKSLQEYLKEKGYMH